MVQLAYMKFLEEHITIRREKRKMGANEGEGVNIQAMIVLLC